ncbi:MAG TPA: hypothetical protein VFG05_13430 [Methylocella sp.]|nr:hypothetical protein [Methylocella sp.]
MSRSVKQERRLLSADELTLVEKTHYPALGDLPDPELNELRKLVRERRDRAQDIAARQRREMRGKASPQGARPAMGDCGTRKKHAVLAAALRRVNKETSRREAQAARLELISMARKALALRLEAGLEPAHPQPGRRAKEGFVPKNAPAYRLRNPAKLGAISQHNKNMQANRDSR